MRVIKVCVFAIVLLWVRFASADVIISEIMYDPASKEDPKGVIVEWVELYNSGDKAVSVEGWYLEDEDGKTTPLPKGATLKPGQAVVLVPVGMTEEEFRKAWGEGFDIYIMGGWHRPGLNGLGNNASEKNEVLSLRSPEGKVADEANYHSEGDWPEVKAGGGPSIVVKPEALNAKANDSGKNWAMSKEGELGAITCKKTEAFGGKDVGSPGKVATKD
ncbi:MAG: lamin tail domain-containing protein [Phycisphaeraceae bacterium]